MDEETKKKIDAMSIKELRQNIASYTLGAIDSREVRYAQSVIEMKEREENNERINKLIGEIQYTGTIIASFIEKLIDGLNKQANKITDSNEKIAKSQGILMWLQVIMAGVLAMATFGLIYVAWLK